MSTSQEISNREHDQIAGVKRVSLFPATSLKKIDASGVTVIYIGVAAAGTADSAEKAWLLERVTVATPVVIDHAVGTWTTRASVTYT